MAYKPPRFLGVYVWRQHTPQNGVFCPQISPLLGSFDLQFLIAKQAQDPALDLPAVERTAFRLIKFTDGIVFALGFESAKKSPKFGDCGGFSPCCVLSGKRGRSIRLVQILCRYN